MPRRNEEEVVLVAEQPEDRQVAEAPAPAPERVEAGEPAETIAAVPVPEDAREVTVGPGTPEPVSGVQSATGTEAAAVETEVFKDERAQGDRPVVVKFDESLYEHEGLNRLQAIAGRAVPVYRGGQRAHGFMTCLEAGSRKQIRLEPGAVFPDGVWVPVNYLPATFIASLR